MLVGLPQRPLTAGNGGRVRGMPRLPSIEAMSAVSSPQTKAPAPSLIFRWKSQPLPSASSPSRPRSSAAAIAMRRRRDGERVLGAHVDVALVRADGVAADEHALEHGVRVAVHDGGVHEGAGVALVAVADDVLGLAGRRGRELPLQARREPGAAAAAQTGGEHLLDELLGPHRRERLARGLVAAPREVLVDVLRVDDPDVAQRDALLRLVERDVVGAGDALAGRRVGVEELLDHVATGEVLRDDLLDVPELQPRVVGVAVRDHCQRALRAEAVAADDGHLHLVLQAGRGDLRLELVLDLQRPGEHTGGAGADTHPAPALRRADDLDLDALGGHWRLRHQALPSALRRPLRAACARPCASRPP